MSLSLGTKTLLVWLAALLLLSLGLSVATAFAIGMLRNRLVADAIRLADEQVSHLRDDVKAILERSGAPMASALTGDTAMRERFRILMRQNDEIIGIVVVDDQGHEIIQDAEADLPEIEVERTEKHEEITKPIQIGERKIGDIKVMLSRSRVLRDIEATSRMVTFQLVLFLITLALVLAGAFLILWRIFRNHLESLQRQNRMEHMAYIGTLSSGLAHEIRNPLNSLNLNLELIEEEIIDPREGSESRVVNISQRLRSQVALLDKTLERFLQFSTSSSKEPERFDLGELVRDVRLFLMPELDGASIEWSEELEAPAILRGDRAEFHEVVVNLVVNAMGALRDHDGERRIEVSLDRMDDSARLTVRDTGPGIDPRDQSRIFEQLFTTREGGTGFGLAITRRIVQEHRGRITGGNDPRGGAIFTVTVPLAEENSI